MDYQKLLDRLYYQTELKEIKLGLATCKALSQALGTPEASFDVIHIAGTNGKGSTALKIAKGLELFGKKVGLYTSPHLFTYRERIQINGSMITEESVSKHLNSLFTISEAKGMHPTFFELTTFLAFLYFREQNVDIAVLETGLGGRLDATNVITSPKLSVITSISKDHTEMLGNSLEEITKEKCGIIKPHCPVLIGPTVPKEIVEEYTERLNCPLTIVQGLFDTYDLENQAIAKKALQYFNISPKLYEPALTSIPSCRMEHVQVQGQDVFFDVGHNVEAFKQLFSWLKKLYPQTGIHVVCGMSSSKEITSCLQEIAKHCDSLSLVTSSHPRLASLLQLENAAKLLPAANVYPSMEEGIKDALTSAKKSKQPLLICGSFFIMEDAKRILGLNKPLPN